MQNSISTTGDHRALVGAYTTSFTIHVPALLRANRLYFLPTMQTSSRKPILNWYPEHFPGPTQAVVIVVVYRRLPTYRCLPPRNASRHLRRTKATTRSPQSVFSQHRQYRKTHTGLCESNSTTRSLYNRRRAPFTSHDFSH